MAGSAPAMSSAYTSAADAAWMQLPSPQQRAAACEDLGPLFERIPHLLRHWNESGITPQMYHAAVKRHTTRTVQRQGLALGFRQGVAYVVDEPRLEGWLGFHTTIMVFYIKVMLLLQELFGTQLPDVQFVVSTIDRPLTTPLHMMAAEGEAPLPVLRFSSSPAFADVTIPFVHGYMQEYTAGLMSQAVAISQGSPWESRQPMLFGRFTPYNRFMHPEDPHTHRVGFSGQQICNVSTRSKACDVRAHFCAWATHYSQTVQPGQIQVDVSCNRRATMDHHARFKYLLHLDGQGVSSRLEQLMLLGALVLREESGYETYFTHMLKPYQHYVPFWKEKPEELLEALQWAQSHDTEAKQIAEAAQQLALTYLGPKGRACYWLKLLQQYAALQRYPVGKEHNLKYSRFWMPAKQYLEETLMPFYVANRKARSYTFMP